MRTARAAAFCVPVVLAAVGCGPAGSHRIVDHSSPAPAAAAMGQPECPSAPYRPRIGHGALGREPLAPPARADTLDGRFIRELALDRRSLVVDPPRAGDRAAYAGDNAVCEVLASTFANNGGVGPQSRVTIAVGLARATVADRLLHGHSQLGSAVSHGFVDGLEDINPKRPAPTPYDDRLAWVVVVDYPQSASCPAMTGGQSAPPSHNEPGHHGYAVFLVDAETGGDVLLYTERSNGICPGSYPSGPFVDVPLTSVSLPWAQVSEQPDRSSAQITFRVTPCDGYSAVAFVEPMHGRWVGSVIVQRPFGPACGPSKQVVQKMRVGELGRPLPNHITHAPTGPYILG